MGAASTQAGGTGMVIIDTLAAARELEAAGIEPKHAEAIVSIERRTAGDLATKTDLGNAVSNLATKAELQEVKSDLREVKSELGDVKSDLGDVKSELREVKSELELKIELVRADLEVRIEQARVGLSRWMLAGWVTQTGVLVTLCWFLFSNLPRV